ncbi:hypothetical protein B0T26DRAFT_249110 [Lasiosphaeria miniovina]|uniref:Uncharacterized protein n=1 Tax=Lasiosphaeria miniovina TaxID=1954250 RepID=A0AA40AW37_9PEZI|nr:uncharacterized protein B0T26DRAFT_249110 [Lasiosphaeria miniovina]KAK0723090.1 hypothetical protein B0T26DRAFT_249110 [Lasiosphaeria miniovina]
MLRVSGVRLRAPKSNICFVRAVPANPSLKPRRAVAEERSDERGALQPPKPPAKQASNAKTLSESRSGPLPMGKTSRCIPQHHGRRKSAMSAGEEAFEKSSRVHAQATASQMVAYSQTTLAFYKMGLAFTANEMPRGPFKLFTTPVTVVPPRRRQCPRPPPPQTPRLAETTFAQVAQKGRYASSDGTQHFDDSQWHRAATS